MKKTIIFFGLIVFLLFAIACDSSDDGGVKSAVENQEAPIWAIGVYYYISNDEESGLTSVMGFEITKESFEYLDYDSENKLFSYMNEEDRNIMPFGKESTSGLTRWDITKCTDTVLELSTYSDKDPHFELTKVSDTSYKVRQWVDTNTLGAAVTATKVKNPSFAK